MKVSEIIRVPEIEKLFPKPANYEEIKADIASRGIQESIVVTNEGRLLCGYTRLSIAKELGIEEIPHRTIDITDTAAMMEYALLDNIRRRQLTDLQLVEYGLQLEAIYGKRQGERSDLGTSCPEVGGGRTRDMVAAEIAGKAGAKMSGRKYARLRTVAMKAAPEVKQAFNERGISQQKALSLCKFGYKDQVLMLESELVLGCAREEVTRLERRLSKLEAIPDKGEASRGCADIARKLGEWQNKCAEIWLRIERRAGELLKDQGVSLGQGEASNPN